MLSVFREHGVVEKDSRENLNVTAEDRNIYQLVDKGWLVVNRMKAWQGSVGISPLRGIVSGHYICFRPRHGESARYLNWLLRSAPCVGEYERLSRGVRPGQAEIDNDLLRLLPIILPPQDEQRRIADFLDEQISLLDSVLLLRERQSVRIQERQAVTIRSALLGEGRNDCAPTRNRWFPELPPNWKVMQLRHHWRVIDCKHRTPTYIDAGYPVISTGDVTPGRLNLAQATRFVDETDFLDLADTLRRPRQGDIVYSRNASLGTASYVSSDERFTMGQDVCRITSAGDQLYLSHVLNFLAADQVAEESIGSTFKRINIDRIRRLEVPVPSPSEQEAIGRHVDEIITTATASVDALHRSRELIKERKRALITAAVTGQFDVTAARAVA